MNLKTPVLPTPPDTYSVQYMDQLMLTLRLFFGQLSAVNDIRAATLNLDVRTLPTEADYMNLRSGDIYRDTSADNVLKVKV